MKSMAFFRKSWRKRDKDKNITQEKQDVSGTKRIVLVPESAPCTPIAMMFEIPAQRSSPSPDHRMRSQSQDSISFQSSLMFSPKRGKSPLSSVSSTSSLVDAEVTISLPPYPDNHESVDTPPNPRVWKSSHGPPKDAFHRPPSLNLYSPVSGTSPRSTGGTPPTRPTRPPRPPPLNLYPTTTKRPVDTGIAPRFMANRAITFALPPNPRAIKTVELASTVSGSPSDSPLSEDHEERASQSSEETARCVCAAVPSDSNRVYYAHQGALRDGHITANPTLPRRLESLPPSSRTAQAVLDLSGTPTPQRVYQHGLHTSSTPHLPSRDKQEVPPVPPLPSHPSNGQADDVSNFPLFLFPPPPQSPLFIRRKISKNLVLRPSPTAPGAPLSQSPSSTSPEYTPLVTPTTPRLQISPNHSRSYSSLPRYHSSRTVPPPLFDPPSTPLPTPPTSPTAPTIRDGQPPLSLRSVRSINNLRPEQLLPPFLHRSTSSEPSTLEDGMTNISQTRRRVPSRPDDLIRSSHPLADDDAQLKLSDSRKPCGYAF